ncbi:hypothetical protein L9F63_001616, partial [Diploptera punctata]
MDSFKATILLSQLIGAFPLKKGPKKKNGENIYILQSILSLIIFSGTLSTNLYSQISWYQQQIEITFIFSLLLNCTVAFYTYITGVVISSLYYETMLNVFNKLLYPFGQFQKGFNEFFKQEIFPLIFGILLIALCTTTLLFLRSEIYTTPTFILFCFSNMVVYISMYVIQIQFITFVFILNQHFYLINCKLLHLSNNTNMFNVAATTSGKVDNCNFYLQTESAKTVLNTLSNLHKDLRMLTQQINTIYSAHILLHVLVIYTGLSFSLYHIY